MSIQRLTYVRNRFNNRRGRVRNVLDACPFADEDLVTLETTYGPNPMRFINSQWCTVVQQRSSGRSNLVYSPEDILEEIEAFDFGVDPVARRNFEDLRERELTATNMTWADLVEARPISFTPTARSVNWDGWEYSRTCTCDMCTRERRRLAQT